MKKSIFALVAMALLVSFIISATGCSNQAEQDIAALKEDISALEEEIASLKELTVSFKDVQAQYQQSLKDKQEELAQLQAEQNNLRDEFSKQQRNIEQYLKGNGLTKPGDMHYTTIEDQDVSVESDSDPEGIYDTIE